MDIVEKLRPGAEMVCDGDVLIQLRCERGDCACVDRLCNEAADEIERLREALRKIAILDGNDGIIPQRGRLGKIARKALDDDKPFEDRWDNA